MSVWPWLLFLILSFFWLSMITSAGLPGSQASKDVLCLSSPSWYLYRFSFNRDIDAQPGPLQVRCNIYFLGSCLTNGQANLAPGRLPEVPCESFDASVALRRLLGRCQRCISTSAPLAELWHLTRVYLSGIL